jgi:hypothetical protein
MAVNLVQKSGARESVDGTWAIAQKEPSLTAERAAREQILRQKEPRWSSAVR